MTITSTINGSYLAGINLAWNAYGADFGTGGWGYLADWNAVNSEFSSFESEGVNTVRWWVFGDGRYSPVFNADGTTAGLNSGFLADIDHALQIASQDHVKLLLTLMDNTMFNFASDGGNGVTLGGHANIVTNPTDRQSFMDNALKPLLQHIAASPYASSVLGYDIINEPEAQIAGGYNGSDFFRGPAQLALSDVQSFVTQAASLIHQYGNGALATVGSAMPIWAPLWIGTGLDFYSVHYYPWMDFNGPGSGLPIASQITGDNGITLDKPVVVTEFPTADTSYGFTDTTVGSAEWYLNQIQARGYAGVLGWSLTAGDSASNWNAFAPVFANWLGAPPPPPPPTQLVNGDFETGNLNGWTLSGNFASQIFITPDSEAGSFAADMGSVGSDGSISQTISTTPGQQYTLDFWLKNLGGSPNDFTAKWDGQSVLSLVNVPAQPYTEYTLNVTASANTTVLEFDARQDPSDWRLDTVSVTPANGGPPPPVDPDVGPELPVLTVGSPALTLPAGGSVALPVTVAGFDSDDAVTVKISGLAKYESVTDSLDGNTFTPKHGSVTLTADEVNSGIMLNSNYAGNGHPSNTLTVTASNSTAGEAGTAAKQTIVVTDPPATTTSQFAQATALLTQAAAVFQNGNNANPLNMSSSQPHLADDISFLTKPHQ